MIEFYRRRNIRLEVGAKEYGEKSFRRPLRELLGEVMEEAEDISGWMWVALKAHPSIGLTLAAVTVNVLAIIVWFVCRVVVFIQE